MSKRPIMRQRWAVSLAALAMLLPVVPGTVLGHGDQTFGDGGAIFGATDVYKRHELSGHETAEPSESGPTAEAIGFEHVSTLTFDFDGDGVLDTGVGSVTDVWEHKGIAYVGTFFEPDCSRFGVRIIDVRDPANPKFLGNVPTMPNTRANDVKVAEVGGRDIMVMTQEPCFLTNKNGKTKSNKGGISFVDVTDPASPELLKKIFIGGQSGSDTNFGVHNTFIWDQNGQSFLGLVDDDNVRDFHVLDISNPSNPTEVSVVGWPDWFGAGGVVEGDDPQGASGLGSFAATFIHDIWVEKHQDRTIGYLSYWDAGLILLDLTDPANPVFMGHSDYNTNGPEGETNSEEGNGHVAVPARAEDGRYLLLGDEDFAPFRFVASYTPAGGAAVEVPAAEGAFTTPVADINPNPLPGQLVSAQGELCAQNGIDFGGNIALISRGTCSFQIKADNAAEQGATGMVVYNDAARGDALVLMGGTATPLFGFFIGNTNGQAIEAELAAGNAVAFDVQSLFDGWGYMRVVDTRPDSAGALNFEEVASFATPRVFQNPPLDGDYTMHNVVMGPAGTDWADTAFVSWYSDGMVALDMSDPTKPVWTGQWIGCALTNNEASGDCALSTDSNGKAQSAATNFWGVYPTVIDGQVYVLGSDRNNGLVILRPVAGAVIDGGLAPGNGNAP